MTTAQRNKEGLTWVEWANAAEVRALPSPSDEHRKAWLAGEDPSEWRARGPIRWVLTRLDAKSGYRTLIEPAQGRYTYATQKEAEEAMRVLEPGLRAKILGDAADSLAVLPVECWPDHHDPKKTVFGVVDLIAGIFWEPERKFEELLQEAAQELKVPTEYLNAPSLPELEREASRRIQEDIFKEVVRDMQRASCTCDAFCDGPCPVHGEAMAAQDARIAAENEEKP